MATIAGTHIKPEIIESFCNHWNIRELSLIGSVLRDDFNDASDVDVMVSFQNDSRWSLLDHVAMRDELVAIFGRNVDLVTRKGVERSRNALRRSSILESVKVFYAAT
ncbi:MAG TPA: nucleotidyltransferase [Desulfuromonadales bacterium]|nr:nucleotidyltransferase [Desulfuromonadales bacterium]